MIDRSYFHSDIMIANANSVAPNSNLLGNGLLLDSFINKYEQECLIKVLGYSLYQELLAQFTDGTLNVDAPQKWKDLVNGKEYQINGIPYLWQGLIYEINGLKYSFIAYYVFAKFVQDNDISHSGVGFQREKAKGAVNVSSRSEWANAYNEFVEMVCYGSNHNVSLNSFINNSNTIEPNTFNVIGNDAFFYVNRFGL